MTNTFLIGPYRASLQKRQNAKSWYCTYAYRDPSGKRIQKQVSLRVPITDSPKKAYTAMVAYITDLYERTGTTVDVDSDVCDIVDAWLKSIKPSVRTNTYERYSISADKIKQYYSKHKVRIIDLTRANCKDFCNFLLTKGKSNQKTGAPEPMAPSTTKDIKNCLSAACDYAIDAGIIKVNPCFGITIRINRNQDKSIKYMDYKTAQRFIMSIPDDNEIKDMIIAAINFGLRRSEVLGLRWEDVDLDNHTLHIRHTVTVTTTIHKEDKTKSTASNRIIPLSDVEVQFFIKIHDKKQRFKDYMGSQYHDSNYIFLLDDGRQIRPDALYKRTKRLLVRFGEPTLTYHSLRHTYASILYERGVDLITAQRLLGHSDPTITLSIYTHGDRQQLTSHPIGLIPTIDPDTR